MQIWHCIAFAESLNQDRTAQNEHSDFGSVPSAT